MAVSKDTTNATRVKEGVRSMPKPPRTRARAAAPTAHRPAQPRSWRAAAFLPQAATTPANAPAVGRPGIWRAAAVILALALASAGCGGRTVPGERVDTPAVAGLPDGETARVAEVIDGDTFAIADGRSVRLIGIDTPETKHPDKGVQCFGKEASSYTARLLPRGTPVRLVADVEPRDRYDRLLAYVYRVADGLFINAVLARDGYARPLTIPPNVAHTEQLDTLAAQARDQGRGLWSACP
jgi:micrococcal nuclease